MRSEANIGILRRYYEECANDYGDPEKRRALAAVDELLSPDFAMYYNNESDAEARHGADEHKEFLIAHTRAFQGERWTVEAIVADEQTVACQWRVQATHTETGNPIDVRAADFFTVEGGRLAALHRFLDWEMVRAQVDPATAEEASAS
jgi:ketosteroid isomerase-like protein